MTYLITYYILLGGLAAGCLVAISFIAWLAGRSRKSKRVYYEYPMEWQQEEYERER